MQHANMRGCASNMQLLFLLQGSFCLGALGHTIVAAVRPQTCETPFRFRMRTGIIALSAPLHFFINLEAVLTFHFPRFVAGKIEIIGNF